MQKYIYGKKSAIFINSRVHAKMGAAQY